MSAVTLRLPLGLTYPEGQKTLSCEAATVGESIDLLLRQHPELRGRIYLDDSRLIVAVLVNGRDVRDLGGMQTALADGDEVTLVPPVIGG